ncbi:hypothetical protein BN2475_540048 [Paraburkholderia ribeironis]|uniref:Uncharacterized protein n=1 Tax=Paraburkholderia ribeironis TaxID=1247936 RepID=A0A1N7SD43_9BURK|nr:hypothetical protein BN2475_540048 [Paraburkholderia ribeironis]
MNVCTSAFVAGTDKGARLECGAYHHRGRNILAAGRRRMAVGNSVLPRQTADRTSTLAITA